MGIQGNPVKWFAAFGKEYKNEIFFSLVNNQVKGTERESKIWDIDHVAELIARR